MDHFTYQRGQLHAEDVPLERIALAVGTPFYVYSRATLERHFTVFNAALAPLGTTICYAVKANSNVAVIATLGRLGAGADVVSAGELKRALAAGIPAERIVFSGVGKSPAELAAAMDAGVGQINVESVPELKALSEVAKGRGRNQRIAVRVNPDVDAKTHAKITTGKAENKFGIEWTAAQGVYQLARELPGIVARSIAVHIGSQLLDLEPYRLAYRRLRDLVALLRADGHIIDGLDLGGGVGIPYGDRETPSPAPEDYAAVVRDELGDLGCHFMVEPGRLIAGNAGLMVAKTLFVKEGSTRTFVILDAAMNDLMRPALYDAYHGIQPVTQPLADAPLRPMDVVGPVCETGDTFAKNRPLPPIKDGDLVAFRTAGAYGAVMAGTYNSRPLIPEVMVDGADYHVVRRRVTIETMLAWESLPDWLGEESTDPGGRSAAE